MEPSVRPSPLSPSPVLLLAPVPALLGSLLVMEQTQAGRTLQGLQALLFLAAMALAFGAARRRPRGPALPLGVMGLALAALLLPLALKQGSLPSRWIPLGGLKLYAASAVLPAALFAFAHALRVGAPARTPLLLALGLALALALQPDAPQATAFALSAGTALLAAELHPRTLAAALLGLAACAALARLGRDPLLPVPWVEGVLEVARGAGWVPLGLAVFALACLPAGLSVWAHRTGQAPAFAVAVYYAVIIGFGAAQRTPMPLMGFGAGPILGYAALCLVGTWCARPVVDAPPVAPQGGSWSCP